MAEVLVNGKKISEMGLVNEVTGEEKIPTSALGDKAVTTGQLLTYVNNNGVAQWGRIGGDIINQVDLQNQFTQERNTLKSYTQGQVSQQQVALQEYIDATDEVFEYTRENGSALPYREGISYEEGAVVVKDGELQQWKGGVWRSAVAEGLSDTIQTFNTPEAGVDPVTGVAGGTYFNVRSTEGDTMLVEYQNIGGVPTPSGKAYPSATALNAVKDAIIDPETGKPTTAKTFVLNPLNSAISRSLDEKLNGEFASIKDGGAIGDGTLHTLQEWVDGGKFSSLAAIKLAYPTAEALTDSIDAVVIQTWVDKYKRVLTPHGIYLINKTIAIEGSGCELYGESVSTYGEGETVKTRFVHAFNGDMITLNTTPATPRGRHRIRGIALGSNDAFSGRAIVLRSSQNHLVDLSFFKFKDGGIRIQGRSYGTYIIRPSFDRCGSNGAYDISGDIDTGGTSALDYNTITVVADGIFETPYTGAISLKDSDPFYLYRNYIEPFSSTSNKPMVDIKNSPSGNTKGWVYDNYIGSINGNGLAISAVGTNLFVNHNMIADFKDGIYFATQTGSCKGNIIKGYTGNGIQVASSAVGVDNNAEVSGNMLLSKTSGATHGIILGDNVNGGTLTSNIVRGKHQYGVRLYSAHNFIISSNNILPSAVDVSLLSNEGIYEEAVCTGNTVRGNAVTAGARNYRRYSWDYDKHVHSSNNTPTVGAWRKGQIIEVPDPVAFGATGYICTTAGTGAAAVWQKYGLIIKQVPARPDVVASDLAALVAAHNALLADLRAANIMAT